MEAQVVSRIKDVGVLEGVDSPHNVHVDRQSRWELPRQLLASPGA